MKKTLMLTALIASVNVYAGSIDYLAQQDAEYFAHASMTGKIGTSGAFYNPAGTAFMEDGLYVKVNTQTVFKNYTMNTDYKGIPGFTDNVKGKHDSDYPSVMVPSIQIVKKDGDRSYFLHGGIAAGGGSLKYNNGISAFEVIGEGIQGIFRQEQIKLGESPEATVEYLGGSKVKGSSFYYNLNLGMAQKLNEKFSVAGGVRFIYATRALEGTGHFGLDLDGQGNIPQQNVDVTIDSEREAYGIGWLVGFNYKPIEKLNIGFKYESEIKLDFEAKNGMNGLKVNSPIKEEDIYGSLAKNPIVSEWLVDGYRNLPAMMSLGISYDVNDRLTLLTSGNYYFIEDANDSNAYAHYTNGYEASVGFDYKLNEQYTLMAGYQYTNTGANEDTYKDTDYALDAHMYSIGLKYTPNETRTYTIAYSYVDYIDGTSKEHGTRFEKQVHAIGLAAEFKL
ncbi:OmpP1/FadL family transporter [Fusobacterium perfoetens]|uniref:OmpP1/FadL family transporter n=1 Tax=Fusobacterium perfoetens TaxID=852 RepID=UPI000484F933|nr:outer membrane protein transport protein [Fusobacterium perfoetens]